jgi:gas vesicle protein
MNSESRVSYFFLGLGIGTAVGILLAPKSGADSRTYLRLKTREGTRYLKTQGEQLASSAAETVERGKRTLHDRYRT